MTETKQRRVSLWVLLGHYWYLHGSYTDLSALVRAVRMLSKNPDVNDVRVQYE